MMNLFEIMQGAQGGNAYDNLARQFGIAPEQARKAVEAVLPAFSMGLQQQAQTMEGWRNILSSLSQAGNSARFYDSDGDGIPDAMENEGRNALGGMLGTPEMQAAMAAQAAHFAGLPASLMQQMLPVIAAMLMGGLFKGATGSGLGGLLGQMMQANTGGLFGAPAGGPAAGGFGGLFGNLLGAMLGGARPAPAPPPDPATAGLDILKGMFETGQKVQNAQIEAFQQIFRQFGGKK